MPTWRRRATTSRCSGCSTAASATVAGWARAGPRAATRWRSCQDSPTTTSVTRRCWQPWSTRSSTARRRSSGAPASRRSHSGGSNPPMADLGIHGMPTFGDGPRSLDEYGRVLELLPPEFSTVWISDHLQLGEGGFNEAWTTATYLAAAFPRYRVGHLVLSQSYRNPALLAKMAATLQHLSGGRYVMGIGAGWLEEEYRAYDFEYPRPGIRVAQLGEAIEVLKAMWTQWPATFVGEHYRVEGAYCDPRPVTPIPILVGTNGPRALRVAARLADMWCWDGPWEASYRQPYETLRSHCEEIERPFDSIAKVCELSVELPADASTFEP